MIREDKTLATTPIMAVTAYSARGDEERIRAAGAQAYVSKPIHRGTPSWFASNVFRYQLLDRHIDFSDRVMVWKLCRSP